MAASWKEQNTCMLYHNVSVPSLMEIKLEEPASRVGALEALCREAASSVQVSQEAKRSVCICACA